MIHFIAHACTCCGRIGTAFSYLNNNCCTQIDFNNGWTELLLSDELFLASVVVKDTFFLSIICMSISRPFHLIFSTIIYAYCLFY